LDQYLTKKKLPPDLKTECNELIEKANQVVEKEIIDEMENIIEKLAELISQLSAMDLETITPEMRASVKSEIEEEKASQQKKSDTRPLKLKKNQLDMTFNSGKDTINPEPEKEDLPPTKTEVE
jgi:hypothetical protein